MRAAEELPKGMQPPGPEARHAPAPAGRVVHSSGVAGLIDEVA